MWSLRNASLMFYIKRKGQHVCVRVCAHCCLKTEGVHKWKAAKQGPVYFYSNEPIHNGDCMDTSL